MAKKLPGEAGGKDPQNNDEQLDPNPGVHAFLLERWVPPSVSSMARRGT
jgi:hypothetical protein